MKIEDEIEKENTKQVFLFKEKKAKGYKSRFQPRNQKNTILLKS